jgi:hypothetical protein
MSRELFKNPAILAPFSHHSAFCTKHCEIKSFAIRYIFFGLHVILCFKEVVLQHTHACINAQICILEDAVGLQGYCLEEQ